jgi:hypothetical protein
MAGQAPLRCVGLGMFLLLSACATTSAPKRPSVESKPVVEFPSQATLAAIAARPAPASGVSQGEIRSRDWTVDGTQSAVSFADRWRPVSSWDNAFAAAVAKSGRDLRLTQAMSCVARELGRFHLEMGGSPAADLERFIVGACGSASIQVGVHGVAVEVVQKATDEMLLSRLGAQIHRDLLAGVPSTASEAGFWFGRSGKHALAVVTYSNLPADVLPFSLVPDAKGEITVEGESRQAASYFSGYANYGQIGVERCVLDPSIHTPRFLLVCPIDPGDETAWIDLLRAPPGRVVAEPFARVLARRTPGQPMNYHAASGTKPEPIAREGEFGPTVLGELNRVRQKAGLPLVRLADAESTSATQLAKHYFDAALASPSSDDVDTIALGLLAGWQVQGGMIRNGSFVSSVVPDSHDAGVWLGTALSLPMARETLLDPQVEQVAFGAALLAGPGGLAAITTGYRFYRGNDHAADIRWLFQRVAAARSRLSLPPPRRLVELEKVMHDQLAGVYDGKTQPMDALEGVLAFGTGKYTANMQGYNVEVPSLDALDIPEEVLKRKKLDLEIGVTHHQPKGAAWGQLVILVVFIDYGEGQK